MKKVTKKDFVKRQLRKGRTRKQAEASWKMLHSAGLERWRRTRSKRHPWAKRLSPGGRATPNPSHWETVGDMLGGDIEGVYEVDKYGTRDIDLGDAGSIPYSALSAPGPSKPDPRKSLYLSRYLSYGDYDGSTAVERSNHQVFMDEHGEKPGVYEIYGSHGASAIGVGLWVDDEDIIETLAALQDYPLISDDAHSEMEIEMQQEAYESGADRDFVHEVGKKLRVDIDDSVWDNPKLPDLFWEALRRCEEHGRYAAIEGGGNVYFPIDEMAASVSKKDLDEAGVDYEPE